MAIRLRITFLVGYVFTAFLFFQLLSFSWFHWPVSWFQTWHSLFLSLVCRDVRICHRSVTKELLFLPRVGASRWWTAFVFRIWSHTSEFKRAGVIASSSRLLSLRTILIRDQETFPHCLLSYQGRLRPATADVRLSPFVVRDVCCFRVAEGHPRCTELGDWLESRLWVENRCLRIFRVHEWIKLWNF